MIRRLILLFFLLGVPAFASRQTRIDLRNQVNGHSASGAGQRPVSTRTSTTYTAQSKAVVDVRDLGIDCTFATDSSAALNALTNVNDKIDGVWLAFPPGCHIRLGSTWTIKNQSAFKISGWSGAGANGHQGTGVPTITWTGAAGGTMIDMEYVDGFEVERLTIDGAHLAGVGINVDKTGSGGIVNTTDGIFNRIVVNSAVQGGSGNPNWIGMRFSAVSPSNVEDMRITDSTFYCGGSKLLQTAIQIANSYNAKNYRIEHNSIHECYRGVWQKQGHATIVHNEVGDNHIDFEVDYWTDPEQINYNLSESAQSGAQFLVLGVNNHVIEVTGNNIPLNNSCAIQFNNGGYISMPSGNSFYSGYNGGAGNIPICNGAGATNSPQIVGPYADFDLNGLSLRSYLGTFAGIGFKSVFDSSALSNNGHYALLSTGAGWLKDYIGYNINDTSSRTQPGYGIDSFAGGAQASTPCGNNSVCYDIGSHEAFGVIEPWGVYCAVMGSDRSRTHQFYMSALDSSGNESLLFPANSASCYGGPATYDSSHYETLHWTPSPGAATYNLYAANPLAPGSQVSRVTTGITGSSYQFNGPYPTTFPVHGQVHGYNQTIVHAWRGKEFDFQYGMPLQGFSDRGDTKKWSISSATGDASFGRDLNIGRNVTVAGTLTAPGVAQTIAIGTATLGTAAIASGACAPVVTVSATGVATPDVITFTPNADISAVTGYTPGGGLIIYPYPVAGAVNFKVCNGAANSVIPGAVTLNWRVAR